MIKYRLINLQNNIKSTHQQFYLLKSSKIPIILSALIGSAAMVFVASLHELTISEVFQFNSYAGLLMAPMYESWEDSLNNGSFFYAWFNGPIAYQKILIIIILAIVCVIFSWADQLMN